MQQESRSHPCWPAGRSWPLLAARCPLSSVFTEPPGGLRSSGSHSEKPAPGVDLPRWSRAFPRSGAGLPATDCAPLHDRSGQGVIHLLPTVCADQAPESIDPAHLSLPFAKPASRPLPSNGAGGRGVLDTWLRALTQPARGPVQGLAATSLGHPNCRPARLTRPRAVLPAASALSACKPDRCERR